MQPVITGAAFAFDFVLHDGAASASEWEKPPRQKVVFSRLTRDKAMESYLDYFVAAIATFVAC
jgi:hypothetical protein